MYEMKLFSILHQLPKTRTFGGEEMSVDVLCRHHLQRQVFQVGTLGLADSFNHCFFGGDVGHLFGGKRMLRCYGVTQLLELRGGENKQRQRGRDVVCLLLGLTFGNTCVTQ
jgi:hypothetical protein